MTTMQLPVTDAEVRKLLDVARANGSGRFATLDGEEFMLSRAGRSPLDVQHVPPKTPVTLDEIIEAIRDGRDRQP